MTWCLGIWWSCGLFCDHPNQTWRVGICNLYMPVAYANYGCMVICAKAFKMSHLVIYFIQDCIYKSIIPYASSFFLRSSCNRRFFMTSWNGMSWGLCVRSSGRPTRREDLQNGVEPREASFYRTFDADLQLELDSKANEDTDNQTTLLKELPFGISIFSRLPKLLNQLEYHIQLEQFIATSTSISPSSLVIPK